MPFPFELPFEEVQARIDACVDKIFSALETGFLTMPKGPGFVEYPTFEHGYQELKRVTRGFRNLGLPAVLETVRQTPIALIVLRAMLGFTPSEWAAVATARTEVEVTQGAARSIDRKIRISPEMRLHEDGITGKRVLALVKTACELLAEGPEVVEEGLIHRLQKADTNAGLESVAPLADIGVPYPMLLYERFLGRPFAGHRDSVSDVIGQTVEIAIEEVLHEHGISARKTKRAERVKGFEQAPDFIVPDEFNPQIVIEAKLAEDDGTARDKVTRVQHLYTLSMRDRTLQEGPRYDVIACIAGRGFKQRREDMKKLLVATRGKVFTLQTIPQIVEYTRLREFATKRI
jgi:hypothetical protein